MKIGAAIKIIGSLSFPSKMPGTSYSLPASACKTGAKLAKAPGTSCAVCYALKGTYTRSNAALAMRRRLAAITDPLWTDAMVTVLLNRHVRRIKVDLGWQGVRRQKQGLSRWIYNEPGWHRWHDSGDLQSVEHLAAINEVARRTPRIKHWLPTQELGMVRRFLANGGELAPNLLVRVSSPMIDDQARRRWPNTSSVFTEKPLADAHVCPAPQQEHRCGSCRACWCHEVAHVAYELH